MARPSIGGGSVGVPPARQRVTLHPEHGLWCEEHNSDWDACIEELIRTGKDSDLLDYEVSVPVIPSENLWARVGIYDDKPNGYRTIVISADTGDGISDVYELGTLVPGEGRLAIRSVLVDWLLGQPFRCNRSTHQYHEQKYLSSLVPGSSADIAERLSMAENGSCTRCRLFENPDEDVPEL